MYVYTVGAPAGGDPIFLQAGDDAQGCGHH